MFLLFLIALVLTWPTFGISIIAWIILFLFKAKKNADKMDRRMQFLPIIEPLFQSRYSDFFMALDIPLVSGYSISEADAERCGRLIMNYLAHNPEEAAIFVKGLDKWKTVGSNSLCDPVTAAQSEKMYDAKGEIHLTSYRAIEALMTNNKNLKCFGSINYGKIIQYRTMIE